MLTPANRKEVDCNMKHTIRTLALVLAYALAFSLCACGRSENTKNAYPQPQVERLALEQPQNETVQSGGYNLPDGSYVWEQTRENGYLAHPCQRRGIRADSAAGNPRGDGVRFYAGADYRLVQQPVRGAERYGDDWRKRSDQGRNRDSARQDEAGAGGRNLRRRRLQQGRVRKSHPAAGRSLPKRACEQYERTGRFRRHDANRERR